MLKLFNKLLARSNSYNYYKSNYEIFKSQSDRSKEHIDSLKSELKNKIGVISQDLKSVQSTQNVLKNEYQVIINEIIANRTLLNVESIKRDSKSGKKINIIFIFNFRNAVMDNLINLFHNDSLFNPVVLIIPYDLHGLNIFEKGLDEHQLKEYQDNYDYFKKRGFNVVKGYNNHFKTLIDIELELRPDIIFYPTPWDTTFPEEFKIKNLPNNVLFCYVPYGIHASNI